VIGRTPLSEEPVECRGITDDARLKQSLLSAARQRGENPSPAELGAQVSRVLANREIAATLAALREAGSEARYLAVDVRDPSALHASLARVRADWGPITGIIHGAGLIADKRITQKTRAQFDLVFDTKVEGLRALLAATQDDPLTLLCMFSSVAARMGNIGQCDYAMANEVLNKVAVAEHRRRNRRCVVRAIGWGPWEGGMVTKPLQEHFRSRGVELIQIDAGARAFVEELETGPTGGVELILRQPDRSSIVDGAARDATLTIEVVADTHPYLADHAIHGKPVVPVALAIEWLARGARARRPDLQLAACRDIQVLRGIRLEHFERGGDAFTVSCRAEHESGDRALFAAELRGAGGQLHYRATVELARVSEVRSDGAPARPNIAVDPWQSQEIYDGHVLFHGPAFQAIRSMEGASQQGSIGALATLSELGWQVEDWLSDPAVVDGALQLAVLWAKRVLGGATLPTAIRHYQLFRDIPVEGPIRCVARAVEVRGSRATCDIELFAADGTSIAELRGVETHLRPEAQDNRGKAA
jgi:NAD(P)-dependent dehydrogenase (short-subunit alcohol dehydrogenase family)